MNVFSTSKIKDEPCDEEPPAVVQNAVSSVNIIKSFLDSECKPEDREYYNQDKCLDEVDGKFKYFSELNCNEVIEASEDCKNLCIKCNKQFSNMLAVQNHYIYSHPCSSMLTKTKVGSCNRSSKIKYNCLNEPIQCKKIPKDVIPASPNIIIPKKVATPEKKVNIEVPEFTLENIKAQPQDGIRVVKKTDINFDRLRMQAEQKILLSKNSKPKCEEADNVEIFKKTYTKPDCVLFTKQVVTTLRKQQKPSGLKYLCRRCNIEMLDAYVFDIHMRRHLKSAFTCPLCTKTFCTKIGISKHSETCK